MDAASEKLGCFVFSIGLLGLAVACSEADGQSPATGGSAGTSGGGGTSAGGGAASGGSSGSGGAGGSGGKAPDMTVVTPTTPTPRTEGALRARLALIHGSTSSWQVQAAFDSPAGFGEYGFACHLSTFEGCELERCGFPEGDAKGTFLHPGTLTLTNQTTSQTLELVPAPREDATADDIYPSVEQSELALNAGDTLHISAAGTADVPAFEATLEVPAKLDMAAATTKPGSVADTSFLGKNGLGFSWTGSPGQVLVRYSYGPYGFSGFDPSFNATAYCAYPSEPGMAGLSPTVISETKCARNSVTILSAYSEQQLKAGDYTVVVQLQEPASVRGYLNCIASESP